MEIFFSILLFAFLSLSVHRRTDKLRKYYIRYYNRIIDDENNDWLQLFLLQPTIFIQCSFIVFHLSPSLSKKAESQFFFNTKPSQPAD